jgi:DNA invertase Pin-like site-specific DNA recombinase
MHFVFAGICARPAEVESEHAYAMPISFKRTMAGLKAARARGRKGGRPKKLQIKDLKTIKALLKTDEVSVQEAAARFGVSRSTLYRNGLA